MFLNCLGSVVYSMRLGNPRNGFRTPLLLPFWGSTVTYTVADESPLLDAQTHLNYTYLKSWNKTKDINSYSRKKTLKLLKNK